MNYALLLLAFLGTTMASSAQNMLGVSTSRYGGTNRIYINPALAADSPSKLYLNGFTANLHVNNNYVRYQAPYSLLRLLTGLVPTDYQRPDGSLDFSVDYTREKLDGKPKNGTLWGEVRGPSMLIQANRRGAFAITTRLRAAAQVTGASERLLSAVRAGLGNGGLFGIPGTDNQFAAMTNTYSELGLTYAGPIWEDEGRRLLLGVTGKALLGYNAQQFINRGLSYRITTDTDDLSSAYLEVNQLDATLAYTTFLQNRTLTPRTLFSPSAPGRGVGFDIGLTYVSQYDADSPALRVGAALTDVGGLSYRGDKYEYNNLDENPVRFVSSDFNNISGSVAIARVIQQRLSAGRNPDSNRFRAGLPTALNLTFDYALPQGMAVSITYLQDARSAQASAVHQPTLLAVTPRYDTRWLTVAVPVAYLNRGLTAGASVRVGPAWLGTDNLLGLLGNTTVGIRPRGLDIYAGVAFGIGPADSDEE